MITIKLEGADRLARELRTLPDRLSRSVQREALRKGGEEIVARATAMAPRAPGAPDLADNIRVGNARSEDGEVAVAIGPTKNFFYALFQEEGTSRHAAQPFLRPAFDAESPRALRIVKDEIWQAILRRGGGSGRGAGGGGGLL